MAKPSDIIPLQVRMPEALRRKLAKAAEDNKRSLNAEIVWRLEHSIEPTVMTADQVIERGTELSERLQTMISKLAEQTIPGYKPKEPKR